ncbi:hypothetical protein GCM10023323_46020 [Streptomyces thinghirensis]|uniref:Uncharacterized protein n=1 Tax=Streptomyces thinghirensis TaxID=551547 RepID=A0ABP9T9I5_9ACTN
MLGKCESMFEGPPDGEEVPSSSVEAAGMTLDTPQGRRHRLTIAAARRGASAAVGDVVRQADLLSQQPVESTGCRVWPREATAREPVRVWIPTWRTYPF